MDQSDMQHGREWSGQDPTGLWLSEKLDGVRAYWDGDRLWTRGGNVIQHPFDLPTGVHLDGELYAGRGQFQAARVAAQHGRFTPAIRFVVFDAPKAPGDWSERMALADSLLQGRNGVATVPRRRCASRADAIRELDRVQSSGGEGLILRRDGPYRAGRSDDVLKVVHADGNS